MYHSFYSTRTIPLHSHALLANYSYSHTIGHFRALHFFPGYLSICPLVHISLDVFLTLFVVASDLWRCVICGELPTRCLFCRIFFCWVVLFSMFFHIVLRCVRLCCIALVLGYLVLCCEVLCSLCLGPSLSLCCGFGLCCGLSCGVGLCCSLKYKYE